MQQCVPELPVGCENESKMVLRVRVRTSMRASTGVQATQGGGESDGDNPINCCLIRSAWCLQEPETTQLVRPSAAFCLRAQTDEREAQKAFVNIWCVQRCEVQAYDLGQAMTIYTILRLVVVGVPWSYYKYILFCMNEYRHPFGKIYTTDIFLSLI